MDKYCEKCDKKPETLYERYMAEFKEEDKRRESMARILAHVFTAQATNTKP